MSVQTTTVVVIGVAGVGKSTVGQALASSLGWAYAEGDDFHPVSNVALMHAGYPLTDLQRLPWLLAVAAWIGEQERAGRDAVVACSALKRSYRDLLTLGHPSVVFCHLTATADVLDVRLTHRPGHFMPASLLASQLATLEPLGPDERGVVVASGRALDVTVADALHRLAALRNA
jgi:gluconokinase